MINHDDPVHQQMLEMAYDAVDAEARSRLVTRINALTPEERVEWNDLLGDIDEWRALMSNPEISRQLETKLIDIPNQLETIRPRTDLVTNMRGKSSWTQTVMGRMAIAACLAVGLALVGYLNWPSDNDTNIPRLSSSLAKQVALNVSGFDIEASHLEINTNDPKALLARLSEKKLTFAPALPDAGPDFKLEGGSIVTFRGQPAVLTVWQNDKHKYLLFQFDPKPFSLPKNFIQSKVRQNGNEVMIWPGAGGACGWALVSNGPMDTNPFYGGSY